MIMKQILSLIFCFCFLQFYCLLTLLQINRLNRIHQDIKKHISNNNVDRLANQGSLASSAAAHDPPPAAELPHVYVACVLMLSVLRSSGNCNTGTTPRTRVLVRRLVSNHHKR